MLDPEQATKAYRRFYNPRAAEVKASEIKTEYDMQVIRWGGRIYLIEPSRLSLFTAAANFSVEPRRAIINENYLTTRFFLRRGDEHKAVDGKPALPEPWNSYLHDSPISAKIILIEIQDSKENYTVNKGSADGVKVGMYLIKEDAKPEYDNLLLVVSVEEGAAKLESSAKFRKVHYQVGNTLVTRTALPLKRNL